MLYSIYAESTPNPGVMKFVSNRILVDKSIEVATMSEAQGIAIAEALLNFPFIKSIYLSSNFISISKVATVEWENIAMQLRVFIADFLNEQGIKGSSEYLHNNQNKKVNVIEEKRKKFSTKEIEIQNLLDQYIKPAVEADGGSITLESLERNIVKVKLQGACSGCPSAAMTLKDGIEALLKDKFHPDIEVQANEK